jgi:putative transposase
VADKARWWERHIVEVLTGLPPQAGAGARIRAEYDPQAVSLRQRELAKVEELRSEGHPVVLRTLQRYRRRYETEGLWGLVDSRFARPSSPTGRADQRVVEAVRQAVREQTDESTGTVDRLRWRVEQILREGGVEPAQVMPSRASTRSARLGPAGRWPSRLIARSGRCRRSGQVSGCRSTLRR